jgi:hypothetical protein
MIGWSDWLQVAVGWEIKLWLRRPCALLSAASIFFFSSHMLRA